MCGIAGILQTNGAYALDHLKRMTNAIAHRGPDGENFWEDQHQNVLLGHRRLAIIDLSDGGRQPFHYLERYVALHNGEIYNYIELRSELTQKGYTFKTQSDTEVLVAAYDCWRHDCVQHFDGMFAFAIWDKEENELFAARDRFGEKPFYYIFDDNDNFLFASEIKAMWPLGLGKSLNRKMLFNFLTIGYTDNPAQPEETFYDDVMKLPAAAFLKLKIADPDSLTIETYWDIDVEKLDKKIADGDAIEKFKHLFSTSVVRRLRSDVRLGTSLSGGLDSSSIVATICGLVAKEQRPDSFSAIFPGYEKNEESFIDEVAHRTGVRSHKTWIADHEIADLFREVSAHQDEPFGSASALPQYKVFGLAKKEGVKVLLDGQGADETLAGYHKYYKWYWQELFRRRAFGLSGEIKKARLRGVQEKFSVNNVIAALFPDFASVFLERQYLLHALRHEDLAKEFVHLQSKEAYYTTPAIFSLNGALYFNTCIHGLEELLRFADRNSMAHGREVRLPFLNHELVEFLFTLPSHYKIRDGWSKWILRQAMGTTLQSSIVWRTDKIGLEPPQQSWMSMPSMLEMIQEAKRKLVYERILNEGVLNKKIAPSSAYEKESFDWRYLVAAQYL